MTASLQVDETVITMVYVSPALQELSKLVRSAFVNKSGHCESYVAETGSGFDTNRAGDKPELKLIFS